MRLTPTQVDVLATLYKGCTWDVDGRAVDTLLVNGYIFEGVRGWRLTPKGRKTFRSRLASRRSKYSLTRIVLIGAHV